MKTQTLAHATRRIFLAASVVATAAITAQAADRHWNTSKVGGSEESPYDIWATENWNGDVGSGNILHFAVSEKTYIESTSDKQVGNDFDVDSGDFVFTGPLYFFCYKSNQTNATSSVVKKGDWTIEGYGMRLGSGSGTTVTFTNESGDVSITGNRNVDSILSVAPGENSTVTVVKEAGDWSVSKTFFIGNGAGSNGRFYNRGGNVSGMSLYGVCLGSGSGAARDAYLEISGGQIKNTGGHLCIGDGDNPGTSTVYVTGNGEYIAEAGYVFVGSRGASTLTIDQNGLVKAPANGVHFCATTACVAGRDCFLNLDGGTLETKTVTYGSGAAAATFTFNGGTLKALQTGTLIAAHNNLTVAVGAGGGVIDNDGYDVTIAEDIGGTGGLTFTGAGMTTLSGAINYTGVTGVAPGTTLKADKTMVSSILSKGIALVGAPAVGTTYTILTSDDDLSDLTLAGNVKCPAASDFTLDFADEGRSITVTVNALNPGWYIGLANGDLSNSANWSDGNVPADNANISCATPATLTKGDTFAPTSITFGEGSAPVTINGGDITGIVAITNLSSVSHTINAKVYFTGDIQVKQNAVAYDTRSLSHVTFAGGAYAADGYAIEGGSTSGGYSRCIFGKYYLGATSLSPWSATEYASGKRVCVVDGSYLYVPYAGNVSELYVGTGAKVEIGDMNTAGRPSYEVLGEMVVTNELNVTIGGNVYLDWDNGSGDYKFEKVVLNGTGGWWFFSFSDGAGNGTTHNVWIGAGGINIADGAHDRTLYEFGARNNDVLYLRPWHSDYTMGTRGKNNLSDIKINRETHFGTTDENGVARTVTVNGRLETPAAAPAAIYIEGTGRFVCNNAYNTYSGAVTVTDTATLVLNQKLTSGAITLGAGTTLALTATGNMFTALTNELTLPTTGAATIRVDGARLTGGEQVIASNVAAGATANVAIDLASEALAGRKATLRVENDKLILNVKDPPGIMLIVF